MARTKISEFSATAADNTDIDNINIAEGCAPSGINNAIRELMSQLKDMQTGASGDTFTLTAVNSTTVDTTNLEVTNLKAKDGTAAGSIADATGVVTLGSSVLTTADINGGTIDNASIGATTPSTVVATQVDITAQGDLRLQDTTGGQYVALQAPGTVASSYTLTLPVDDGTAGQALITDGSGVLSWSTAASGDVYGPASATDNAVARYDSTTGKIIQNSAVTIADDGATVIDANSTSAALRITQFGTGNALLVEDSSNPDGTPFIIDASGNVGVGVTPAFSSVKLTLAASGTDAQQWNLRYSNDTAGYITQYLKSRGTALFTPAIVASGDIIGLMNFGAWDSAAYTTAAQISAQVDGTPGTNDMPGRLVFSTTADGASSPTERMRIDSAGRVGIGGTPTDKLTIMGDTASGTANPFTVVAKQFASSSATGTLTSYLSFPGTIAASFTLAGMKHYSAGQGTFGAGSAVTNQYGFTAESSLTGATNNYGFYSAIASGTGRWNFYAAGSAANYFAGLVGIGSTAPQTQLAIVAGTATGQTAGAGARLMIDGNNENNWVDIFSSTTGAGGIRFGDSGSAQQGRIGYQNNGDFLDFYTNATERMRIASDGSVGIGGASFGSGAKVMFIANATTAPTTNPSGGGIMYVEGGALKYRGSSGTVTTIANA